MKTTRPPEETSALKEENRKLRAELEQARLSEKRFLDALRLSPMALCHHDRDLRYTWLYNGHMGFVQDDVIGLTDWDILDQDLADRMGVIKQRVLDTGIGERVEMPTVSGDENSEYFDLVVEPLKDRDSGDVVGLSCSGIDVTEDRRRREAYKAAEENLRFIFNASPMPIVVTRQEDGSPLFFNHSAEKIFNLNQDENVFDLLGVRADVDGHFAQNHDIDHHKLTYENEDGATFYLSMSCTRIFYDGEAAVLASFQDLTSEVQYQKRLEEAKERAELANLAKSQFLASASHDLRQPLHAMGLLLNVLENYISNDAGVAVLKRVTTSLEAMNDLFSGILDISKLDANAVPVKLEPVDVAACFEMLKQEFMPLAQKKGLGLIFVNSTTHIATDRVQFERILRNLISNAIRYTQSGRILIGARRQGQRLRFYVCDNGVGIAPTDQELIFQEFRQIGNPERDRRKGLGLGLAICDRLSRLLDTEIEVKSKLGQGSVFSFDQPLTQIETGVKDVSHHDDKAALVGKCIMFVEDEIDVQVATRYMLETWDCEPWIVGSVKEARDLCETHGRAPDFLVADYRLRKDETGLQAIQAVREWAQTPVPALILSGETAPELIQHLESQKLPFLNKPIMPRELHGILVKELRKSQA